MNNYVVKALTPDLCRQADRLREAFYRRPCAGYHLKKYFSGPGSEPGLGAVAVSRNRVIAFAGILPVTCSISQHTVNAGQNCDLLVSPENRSTGAGEAVLEESLRLAAERSIHFTFGFTHRAVDRWLRPLQFHRLGSLRRFTFSFNNTIYRRISRRLLMSWPAKNDADITNRLITEGFDGVIYDQAYRNLKRLNGCLEYGDNACAAWLSQNRSYIGAVGAGCDAKQIVQMLDRRFRPDELTYMCSEDAPISEAFTRHWNARDSMHVMARNISGVHSLKNLRFQMADADFF